mgnify:CR=1 FL=1
MVFVARSSVRPSCSERHLLEPSHVADHGARDIGPQTAARQRLTAPALATVKSSGSFIAIPVTRAQQFGHVASRPATLRRWRRP